VHARGSQEIAIPDLRREAKKKLGTTLELLQWKAKNGVSDKGFGELLTIIKKMLSKTNKLLATTYAANTGHLPSGIRNP
jgi:hypothetical protein